MDVWGVLRGTVEGVVVHMSPIPVHMGRGVHRGREGVQGSRYIGVYTWVYVLIYLIIYFEFNFIFYFKFILFIYFYFVRYSLTQHHGYMGESVVDGMVWVYRCMYT